MSVVIRLARTGRRNLPFYRVTVADGRACKEGKFLDVVGWYNPCSDDPKARLKMDLSLVDSWIKKGAQPTDSVKHLITEARTTSN